MLNLNLSGVIGDKITAAGIRDSLDPSQDVAIRLTSEGGDFFEAVAILNMLRNHPKKVSAHVEGMALSAGTIILLGASSVSANSDALLMVHEPMVSLSLARAEDLRRTANQLEGARKQLVELYQTKTRKAPDEIDAAIRAETWMTATEAAKWGLVDKVVQAKAKVRNCIDPARWPNAPREYHRPPLSERAVNLLEKIRKKA